MQMGEDTGCPGVQWTDEALRERATIWEGVGCALWDTAMAELVLDDLAPEEGPDLLLQDNGRYAHKRSHVQQLCKQAGFESVQIEDVVIRQEAGQPVQGFLVMARKAAA